ncbi:MAG TPA: peptidoglycan-binding protein [Bryobacteraceae bacterium]|nr:peptidoglycan-binding protein [Bryobacteraceae bacterium]
MAMLTVNAAGPEITALQNRLRQRGFDPGPSDGAFGPATRSAVMAFQRNQGLVADGVVGPRTAAALGLIAPADVPSALPGVTLHIVSQMFPVTPVGNIRRNLPIVLDALIAPQLTGKSMVLMALATIRAETESFEPISESPSRFNTSPGGLPFDLYDHRKDLGNTGYPDGARFCGRGFVQLTGRANYQVHGAAIGLGDQLIDNPELANDPQIAARLLASFLKARELAIRRALLDGELKTARRLVNGGTTGLDRFQDAYRIGARLIPDPAPQSAAA